MTAMTRAVTGRGRSLAHGWGGLCWVTWRQHRTAFLCVAAVIGALATLMMASRSKSINPPQSDLLLLVLFVPVLGGVILGAPLLAAEAERGTSKVAWTQGVSRIRWLTAQYVPAAVVLGLAGGGLGLLVRWYLAPVREAYESPGSAGFALNPLPFAGWMVFGLTLGVFLGCALRLTLPAAALTAVAYVATAYLASRLRTSYLPPLIGPRLPREFRSFRASRGIERLSSYLGWPDGRPLSPADELKPAHWLAAHHIRTWITYQPASRFGGFEVIEFGWLIVLSLMLAGLVVVLISRRRAA
ncbi:MAG TPA: hypothetical protein VMA95_03180 [Streptosporangiaceae bacterium]|nr:hypothetical protein [Streptosporangiaceae bacterium]